MKRSKKPPPDDPGNLAGRRRRAREAAWMEACGGIRIIVTNDGKSERPGTYAPPPDVKERFKKILARKLKELEARLAARGQPKPKPKSPDHPKLKTAPSTGKVNFFQMAKQR